MGSNQYKNKQQGFSGDSTQYKNTGGTPPPADECYVFDFDTLDAADEITAFTYGGGAGFVPVNVSTTLTTAQIEAAIELALDAEPITYTSVAVVKTPIGGGLTHFTITIKNPSVIFSFIFITGGSFFPPVINNCP